MNFIKVFFLVVLQLVMALGFMGMTISTTEASITGYNDKEDRAEIRHPLGPPFPLRGKGISRFDAVKKKPKIHRPTCDKFPRICRGKGSPGPDCCKKKCVNVMLDGFNCGMCGNKCKYGQICCGGNCVNPFWDERHCGGCNMSCKKGDTCFYGMCNYGY